MGRLFGQNALTAKDAKSAKKLQKKIVTAKVTVTGRKTFSNTKLAWPVTVTLAVTENFYSNTRTARTQLL
jgi:hypothetical protein